MSISEVMCTATWAFVVVGTGLRVSGMSVVVCTKRRFARTPLHDGTGQIVDDHVLTSVDGRWQKDGRLLPALCAHDSGKSVHATSENDISAVIRADAPHAPSRDHERRQTAVTRHCPWRHGRR